MAEPAPPVALEISGKRKTFTGDFAKLLAYLYRHAEIFVDIETTGNFVISLKGGHIAHRFDDAVIGTAPSAPMN